VASCTSAQSFTANGAGAGLGRATRRGAAIAPRIGANRPIEKGGALYCPAVTDDRRARAGAAFIGYLVLTIGLTYPLIRVMGAALPSDPGDPVLNTWILWWNTRAVPFTHAWWQAPAFYPAAGVLAFSEHLLGLAWIATPVRWLTGSPVVAYNVAFLLSFALSGWAAYLLAFELTGRRDAAWVGGALYAFCAYRVEQLAHLQMLSSYWVPIALLALHRFRRSGRRRWLAAATAAVVLQGLSNGYLLLYLPVLLVLWGLWFLRSTWSGRLIAGLAAAGAAAAALVLPALWSYRDIHARYGFSRTGGGLTVYGADITSMLSAPAHLRLWHVLHVSSRAEGHLFPGLAAPLLIAAALATRRRLPRVPDSRIVLAIRRGAAVLLIGYAALLVSRLLAGPWSIALPFATISVVRWDKLLADILALLAVVAASSPWVRAAWQRGSPFAFYLMATAAMWLFALGPAPTFLDRQALSSGPYQWLLMLPGYDGLRMSGRFWMLGAACASAAGALAFAKLVAPAGRWRHAALTLVTVVALGDGWMGAMPVSAPPARSPLLERYGRYPVLELPMSAARDTAAMYRGIFHGQPVANGYSGYEAPHYAALQAGLSERDPAVLVELARLGVRDVRIDLRADRDGTLAAFVAAVPGATEVARSSDEALFRLPSAPALPPPQYGPPIAIAHLHASVAGDELPQAIDGRPETGWHAGAGPPDPQLQIDLGTPQPVGAVVVSLGRFADGFPRELAVESSRDGRHWSRVFQGPLAAPAIAAALRDPRMVPIVIDVGGGEARYLRLEPLAPHPVTTWSVANLQVLAPPAA
jgi:F5/8 type C domain